MGYDMSQVQPMTAEEEAVLATKREAFNEAVKKRGEARAKGIKHTGPDPVEVLTTDAKTTDPYQLEVERTSDELYDADKSYFRLNIWGMDYCRNAMAEIGMLYWAQPELDFPDYNEPKRNAYGSEDAWLRAVEEYEDEHEKQCIPAQKQSGGGRGIPSFKVSDNSGWWVTKEECQEAVDIWEEYQAANDPGNEASDETKEVLGYGWWPKWIEYLKRGAQTDGFRVY